MRLVFSLLVSFVVLLLVTANCEPLVPTPTDPTSVDSGPPPDVEEPDAGESDCQRTCRKYERLTCKEAEDTPKGGSCEDVCENAAESGYVLAKEPGCAAESQTCDALRACPAMK